MNALANELIQLLGEPVVFIKWPKGVKGAKQKWKHLKPSDMTPEYRATLGSGNVGVALGTISGGLCAIDLDDDKLVEPFLATNPRLKETLQTHGSRGRVFWVRCSEGFPKRTIKLKTRNGEDAGEFRSDGSQSIIWGIHPDTKKPYEFVVNKPVVEMDFHSIRWPEEIKPLIPVAQCTEDTEETEDRKEQKEQKARRSEELKSSASLVGGPFHSTINSIEDALRVSMPSKGRENNKLLFKLARALLTLQMKGREIDSSELESTFNKWHERATPFLREGKTREDYYLEFMNACERAKYPLGSVKIAEAWKRAKAEALPIEAFRFDNPDMRLLVALLKEMQLIVGNEPFFITYRDCAALLGHKTHSTVSTWMGALTKLKFIRVVEAGNHQRATRYRYVWDESSLG